MRIAAVVIAVLAAPIGAFAGETVLPAPAVSAWRRDWTGRYPDANLPMQLVSDGDIAATPSLVDLLASMPFWKLCKTISSSNWRKHDSGQTH